MASTTDLSSEPIGSDEYDPTKDIWKQMETYGGGSDRHNNTVTCYHLKCYNGMEFNIDESVDKIEWTKDSIIPDNGIEAIETVIRYTHGLGCEVIETSFVYLYEYLVYGYTNGVCITGHDFKTTFKVTPSNLQKAFHEYIGIKE